MKKTAPVTESEQMALTPAPTAGGSNYLALQSDAAAMQDWVTECCEGGLSIADLERVKVPGAGGMQWEIPGADGPEMDGSFSGIIIGTQTTRAYWAEEFTGEGTPPACRSSDGITGLGTPGGDCAACPLNEWGTGKNNMGTACSQRLLLYVLREQDALPVVLSLPVTSLKNFRQYRNRLLRRRKSTSGVITAFALERTKSTTGITYSLVTFSEVAALAPTLAPVAKTYAKTIKAALGLTAKEDTATTPPPPMDLNGEDIPDADPPFGHFARDAEDKPPF